MSRSKLIIIAARSKNNVIGLNNKLPWHITQDLQFFKKQTLNKPMIMGRKTRDSFGEKPLPNRPHLVISTNPDYKALGSETFLDIQKAIEYAETLNTASDQKEIYIIGGGRLYQQTIDHVDRLIISEIDTETDGDTFFPQFYPQLFSQKTLHTFTDIPTPFKIIQYDRLR